MTSKYGGADTVVSSRQHYTSSTGENTYSSPVSVPISSNYWRLERGETHNYRKKVARGDLLPLNYYYNSKETLEYSGSWGFRSSRVSPPAWWQWVWEPMCPHPYGFRLSEVGVNNRAGSLCDSRDYVQSAAAKIYSSGWDALTFAAELRSTIDMFCGVGRSLVNLLKHGGANTWLQYRYGWRTLYYDLQDIVKAINSIDDSRKRFRESAGSTVTQRDIRNIPFTWPEGSGNFLEVTDYTVKPRGVVVADITPPKIAINPITTAWELVKYSFVVDWFINVGQWLAAMSFLAIKRDYFGSAGIRVEASRSATLTGFTPVANATILSSHFSISSGWSISSRVPSTVPLGFSTITRLEIAKVTDLIAMMVQMKGR